MNAQDYWNQIGSGKEFEDPLYLEKLAPYLTVNAKILEYGCGYGRLLQFMHTKGYHNLVGFDFSEGMIQRGKNLYPHLGLQLIGDNNTIPLPDGSVDVVVMSTVLCCIVDDTSQMQLFQEFRRVLRENGILYLTDYLLCDHPKYQEKYARGFEKFGVKGVYTTSENLTVRHYTTAHIMKLLHSFDIHWFEQFDFKTMNNNPARTFHCIAKKNH